MRIGAGGGESMSDKKYHDAEGNPTTLWRLVRDEPEWAVSIIKTGERSIAERDTYRELCGEMIRALSAINEHDLISVSELITKAEKVLGEQK
jgi:hypothetical protein